MAKLGDLVVNIGANTKDLNKKLGRVRRDMRSMSSNFTAVGKSMSRNITMPLALVGGAALKLAVDFEDAMAQVQAVSGATASEFKKLEDSAKDLGASTVFTAREVAALQLEYSRLGFSADEIVQVQEATLNLAQATGSDLAQAAEVAGATLRAFGMDASETGKVTDVMAASFSASALNINTFQDSMKFVAPISKAAGVSLEETSAMLAVLANSGIKGSQAGTALRRILQEMQGTTGTLTERFAELSAKGIGLEGAMDEVGRRAATSLLVLTEGAGQVDELTGSFENSEGAAKSMADVINDKTKGQLKAMTSALEGAGIALGEVLMPHLKKAAEFVRDLATKFRDLDVDTQSTIINVGMVAAAIGPLLIMIPKIIGSLTVLTNGFRALSIAMLANPFTAVIAAGALLGGMFLTISTNTNKAVEKNKEFIASLGELDKEATAFAIKEEIRLLKEEKTKLEIAQRAAERQLQAGGGGEVGVGAMSRRGGEFLKFGEDVQEATDRIAGLEQSLLDAANASVVLADSTAAVAEVFVNSKAPAQEYLMPLEKIGVSTIQIDNANKNLVTSNTSLMGNMEEITVTVDKTQQAMQQLGTSLGNTFGSLINGAIDGKQALKQFASQVIAALVSTAIANAIANGSSATNPANQLSAGITIPSFITSAVSAVAGAITQIPAFADGGMVYGPGLAMVGDNKNAAVDPEVIAPLSKLKSIMGGNGTNVYGRISGDDIVISNNRATRDRNRFE